MVGDLRRLPDAVQRVLDREQQIRTFAERFADSDAFFFVGRGPDVAIAKEGALKMKEVAYVPSEGFPAGELKHGTLAVVSENTPVLAIVTDSATVGDTRHNIREVGARGVPVLGFGVASGAVDGPDVDVNVPEIGIWEPLVANVGVQLFAYHVANEMNRPVDRPRNLAKSITVR